MKIYLKDPKEFRKVLLLKGHSQRTFAELVEITPPYLNQIVNGERFPSGKVAKKIVDVLEMEFEDIFFINDACKSYQN
ncbi:helix-turn-helix transcriptional regulator [Peribacillus frigoritolerans]|uniref:helix-turn-helix transcriptional regulator n=1 Tax=Peribacillus frigoritolerans TaxID=450367 RepID=UPI00207A8A48|nr:helix-turn-helix transcriptional regulator [Peribacillus frigoritolerans]USK66270.1 helix-turn-helix domain-containing protein [Peribacillus frigoritolerans]